MLAKLLAERDWLLADGATGTNLFDMGLTSGDAPELWIEAHPDRITSLHRQFVDAGADIILTNTFGCNRRRLALHNLEAQTRVLNAKAARLARAVADTAGRPVVVAGSVGPTGDLFVPLGALTEEDAVQVFIEQIEGLKQGGVDVVWIETMSAVEEIRAAAVAAQSVGLPYVTTASFDTAGRTMMGVPPAGLPQFTAQLFPQPIAVGSNCGVGATDLLVSILAMTATDADLVVVAKGNCGIPVVKGEHVHYSGTPELMAEYARLAVDSGARIVGGCCGTSPMHLAAMRRALDGHTRRPRPSVETIVAAIGPVLSPPPRDDAPRRENRRNRPRS